METSLTAEFADGEYRFHLLMPQIVALERACDNTSIMEIEERLRAAIGVEPGEEGSDPKYVFLGGGAAMIADVTETIRLGLIGGNHALVKGEQVEVGPIDAKNLVAAYVSPARPLSEGVVLAWRILHATIFGVALKKKAVEPEEGKSVSRSEKGR